MTCRSCGRPAENGRPTHWMGCEAVVSPVEPAEAPAPADRCGHGECLEPKKAYSGRGARPKYCETHSDPKNRK